MNEIRYTLIGDGSSDRMLLPILKWLLEQHFVDLPLNGEWADLSRLPTRPKSLAERISKAVALYPCDLLFIHRDAERMSIEDRVQEIETAIHQANHIGQVPHHICVVPIRMSETWLLFDAHAIRSAASNPNGTINLQLPPLNTVENIPDPKSVLYNLLTVASELNARRKKKFRPHSVVQQLANYAADFSPLYQLEAFNWLNNQVMNYRNLLDQAAAESSRI